MNANIHLNSFSVISWFLKSYSVSRAGLRNRTSSHRSRAHMLKGVAVMASSRKEQRCTRPEEAIFIQTKHVRVWLGAIGCLPDCVVSIVC